MVAVVEVDDVDDVDEFVDDEPDVSGGSVAVTVVVVDADVAGELVTTSAAVVRRRAAEVVDESTSGTVTSGLSTNRALLRATPAVMSPDSETPTSADVDVVSLASVRAPSGSGSGLETMSTSTSPKTTATVLRSTAVIECRC